MSAIRAMYMSISQELLKNVSIYWPVNADAKTTVHIGEVRKLVFKLYP
jgi:hypothetical protein